MFWCSISLHESSFQIPGSRNDLFVVGHLWCLSHFFCNFLCWKKAVQDAYIPSCVLPSSDFAAFTHGHKSVLKAHAVPSLVWHPGCALLWITECRVASPSTTGDEYLQLDYSVSAIRQCKCRGSWHEFLKLGRSSRILLYFHCPVSICMVHIFSLQKYHRNPSLPLETCFVLNLALKCSQKCEHYLQ